MEKRSMDFMGTRVSYPQYLRLVAIQREVIRMDVTIRYHPYMYYVIYLKRGKCSFFLMFNLNLFISFKLDPIFVNTVLPRQLR